MDINVRPNWKWTPAGSRSALPLRPGSAPSPSLLKQALMPRSVDLNLSFALKYRR
jgi:hypothetical protein